MTVSAQKKLLPFILIFALAFMVRFYQVDKFQFQVGDESMHPPTAANYVERGFLGPDYWHHPPLKHILLYASMRLFGNDFLGLRMRNVLFGAATVVMVLAVSEMLFGIKAALVSSGLILLDPLHVFLSRTTFEEIPATFFLVSAVYFSIKIVRDQKERHWVFSGIFFGLAAATKWYSLSPQLVIFLILAIDKFKKDGWAGLAQPVSYIIILPLTIYLLAYMPWFGRGHSLLDWLILQKDALWSLRHISTKYNYLREFAQLGSPITWFIRFVGISYPAGPSAYISIMNNLPVWIFVLPSTLYMLYEGVRKGKKTLLVIALVFWSLYIPILVISHPFFLYAAIPLLPFGFISIGYAAGARLQKQAWLLPAALMIWSLLLYPLTIGLDVPIRAYWPLITFINIFKVR